MAAGGMATRRCDHCSAPVVWRIDNGHEDFWACSRHLPQAALEATAGLGGSVVTLARVTTQTAR